MKEENTSYIADLVGYNESLEDYIEYIYCPMIYGTGTAIVTYDLNTVKVATEVMLIKIQGEDIKLPPMNKIDCREAKYE